MAKLGLEITIGKKEIIRYIPMPKLEEEFENTFQMKMIRLVQDKLGLPRDLPIEDMKIYIHANKPIRISLTTHTRIK